MRIQFKTEDEMLETGMDKDDIQLLKLMHDFPFGQTVEVIEQTQRYGETVYGFLNSTENYLYGPVKLYAKSKHIKEFFV